MARRKIKVGDHWKGVVYKGKNIIIQQIKEGHEEGVFIGNGHSIELDENNNITWADPGMHEFRPNIGKKRAGVAVYTFYFIRKVANLSDSAKELASFINTQGFKRVALVGHSKCGICVEETCNYTNQLVNVCISVSAPHAGTFSASGKLFSERLRSSIFSSVYMKVFSDHQVDRDILPESSVIKNVHRPKCITHINFVSVLELKTAWKNPTDLGSLWLDRRVGMYGDAIVPEQSQRVKWTDNEQTLHCSHARSLDEALRLSEGLFYLFLY